MSAWTPLENVHRLLSEGTRMMHKIIATNIRIAILMIAFTSGLLGTGLAESEKAKEFLSRAESAREAFEKIRKVIPVARSTPEAVVEARMEAVQILSELMADTGYPGYYTIRLLYVQSLTLGKENQDIIRLLTSSFDVSVAVETIWILSSIEFNHISSLQCEKILSELIPISTWQIRRNQYNPFMMSGFLPPPRIPGGNRKTMKDLPVAYSQAGMNDLAWRSSAEMIYSHYHVWHAVPNATSWDESWLSTKSADDWANTAEYARLDGKDKLAGEFLMKAAISGDERIQPKVKEIASRLFDDASTSTIIAELSTPARISKEIKREALKEILRLNTELRAHPRSLTIIEEYGNELHDSDTLRNEIESDWVAKVQALTEGDYAIILYGTEVHPNGNPLDVKIPWAFSDEAVAEARKLIMEKPDEEKD